MRYIDTIGGRTTLEVIRDPALFEGLVKALRDKYPVKEGMLQETTDGGFGGSALITQSVLELIHETSRSDDLRGKTLLDLGCGSTDYHEGSENWIANNGMERRMLNRTYEPWHTRAMHELGINVIGIDIGSLEGEEFEHYSLDLRRDLALNVIPSSSMDYVFTRAFYDAMILDGKIESKELEKKLIPQIKRVLKPMGMYIYRSTADDSNNTCVKREDLEKLLSGIHK